MKFDLFMYCTVGRRHELESGLAGLNNDYYQRMLNEISETKVVSTWFDGKEIYSSSNDQNET